MAIKIDAETLRSNATTLSSYKETHDENINSIKQLIHGMCNTEVFDGATATAYLSRLESYEATMTSFSDMLDQFAQSLTTVANQFEETDNSLAGSLNA